MHARRNRAGVAECVARDAALVAFGWIFSRWGAASWLISACWPGLPKAIIVAAAAARLGVTMCKLSVEVGGSAKHKRGQYAFRSGAVASCAVCVCLRGGGIGATCADQYAPSSPTVRCH